MLQIHHIKIYVLLREIILTNMIHFLHELFLILSHTFLLLNVTFNKPFSLRSSGLTN